MASASIANVSTGQIDRTGQAARTPEDTLGRALRDLRISVTDRCNFRCGYCMPAEVFGERYRFLPKPEILTFEEIERLARVFVRLGSRKLRITGGEPLLRAQLSRLVERLAGIDDIEDLALTTNGYLLEGQAEGLRSAGLQRITISLDSLNPDTFKRMNGLGFEIGPVLAGIAAAERAGFEQLKFNCVVQRGVNVADVGELARHFRGTGHIVRFIEYMDVGTLNGWNLRDVVPAAEIVKLVAEATDVELAPIEANYGGEVAQRYAYADGSGEVGIIASVTQPFCGGCTRARLSADGQLFTCLFAKRGTDLKSALRSGAADPELQALLERIWLQRADRYSDLRSSATDGIPRSTAPEKVEMYQIGG